MASKQLGRLRQWAEEVISSKDSKSEVNEEFRELEKDIELRKDGIQRLIVASEEYHHALSKRKQSHVLDEGEKMLPVDSLGVVMIIHGEEFGEDSVFGNALVKLGRAHCKIATLQEAYALTFKDTFISSMERFKEEIKEYELLKKKKLETRRAASDSATAKFEKLQATKKERDKREAEDEMDRARQRYEETAEDLRAHMHAIQENEHGQHHELATFLDTEINFVQSYLDVLKDLKAEWQNPSDATPSNQINGDGRFHTSRPASKASFRHSSRRSRANSSAAAAGSSDDESIRPSPINHARSGSTGSKASSRPTSRLSRKRTNSTAAPSSGAGQEEKEAGDRSRRMSVVGWASSAVESVTGKNKKNKDKDSFASLEDPTLLDADRPVEGDEPPKKSGGFRVALTRRTSKSKSKENLPTDSPSLSTKILKPPSLQDKKVVRALYDFSGSSDELSFKAGCNIIVVHEVLDDWWMGELDGQRGMFPTAYTEVITSKPPVPDRSNKNGNVNRNGGVPMVVRTLEDDTDLTSDADDEQILRATPMPVNRSPVFYGAFNDSASLTGSMADDEEERKAQPLMIPQRVPFPDESGDWFLDHPQRPQQQFHFIPTIPLPPSRRSILRSLDPANQPLISRSVSEMPATTSPTNTKKVPPPPPPRRTMSHNPALGPPIPERKTPAFGFSSQPVLQVTPPSSIASSHGYDRSPFDSALELEEVEPPKCERFRQNPFKPKGMCSNCLEFHD
ncbi:hypothetical protein M413DRAFT_141729 [Hebeloma cylindrosporum]|uniref:SH3 domain-containing protein n=1 Tax=Hebeloma cylindrosporum TaxID=76867 RepID=A0A0C2YLS2_HEBCY|nr:hypothetical protein M413DRAFT_141729 [Hebeloma cylindrosporum h7]